MTCDRLDILDERLRRLRHAVECLEEEHTSVREQVETLETVVRDEPVPASDSARAAKRTTSRSSKPDQSEASDEDVAAAVRAAETDANRRESDDPLTL